MEEPPGMVPGALHVRCFRSLALQVLADVLEDLADNRAEEDEGHDHDDRDEGQKQTVLDERLTFLIVAAELGQKSADELKHALQYLLSSRILLRDAWVAPRTVPIPGWP